MKRFSMSLRGYGGALVGCSFEYSSGRDLTEKVLLWWMSHKNGDTPQFYLGDAIAAMGGLWDCPRRLDL